MARRFRDAIWHFGRLGIALIPHNALHGTSRHALVISTTLDNQIVAQSACADSQRFPGRFRP
jgi:hypothetical protein